MLAFEASLLHSMISSIVLSSFACPTISRSLSRSIYLRRARRTLRTRFHAPHVSCVAFPPRHHRCAIWFVSELDRIGFVCGRNWLPDGMCASPKPNPQMLRHHCLGVVLLLLGSAPKQRMLRTVVAWTDENARRVGRAVRCGPVAH